MQERYTIEDARDRLVELIERAAAGEEILLGTEPGPLVVLRRYDAPKERRSLGALKGRIQIASGFDDPSPELMKQLGLEK
jgi:antitoxin (DNA-binding transcriptional repressor) of toxin-antitoxin stability system